MSRSPLELELIPEFVAACGFQNAKVRGYEADDILGVLCAAYLPVYARIDEALRGFRIQQFLHLPKVARARNSRGPEVAPLKGFQGPGLSVRSLCLEARRVQLMGRP